jgi:hypothetical protein
MPPRSEPRRGSGARSGSSGRSAGSARSSWPTLGAVDCPRPPWPNGDMSPNLTEDLGDRATSTAQARRLRGVAVLSLIVFAGLLVSPPRSHAATGALRIASPANGASVGPTFSLEGTREPTCAGGPVSVNDTRGHQGLLPPSAGPRYSGNTFAYSVDFRASLAYDADVNPGVYVAPGSVTLTVSGGDCPDAAVSVNYLGSVTGNADRSAARASSLPTPETPTPSPAASPLVSPTPAGEGERSFPPLALGLGALVGGAAVAAAEWSAVHYRRRP